MAKLDPDLARKDAVGFDEFMAVDMRVGRVVDVQGFPEARQPAYKIAADFGPIGILWTSAQVTHYSPEQLQGRSVVGAINLGTKRIAGFESQFLLLGSFDHDGTVQLLRGEDDAELGGPIA